MILIYNFKINQISILRIKIQKSIPKIFQFVILTERSFPDLIVLTGPLCSLLKCLDISHCPKTYHSSVGLPLSHDPFRSDVGTLRTVP